VQGQDTNPTLLLLDEAAVAPVEPDSVLFIGTLNGTPCMAGEVSLERELPTGWRAVGIRTLFDYLDEDAYGVVGYASHVLDWQRNGRFCPVCGNELGALSEEWMRQCSNCGYMGFPPVSPAILVLVHEGPRVLLAHKPGWGKRFSIVAGFVGPGESLEQCVEREVAEEVGVEIADIIYISSQPWPFPHQIMIGFMARYVSGEICPDQKEIDEAAWFRFDQLPELPPPLSLSRQLIDKWASAQK
jgi:NAD+ diphosphatase